MLLEVMPTKTDALALAVYDTQCRTYWLCYATCAQHPAGRRALEPMLPELLPKLLEHMISSDQDRR
jgi:hypothetical protein